MGGRRPTWTRGGSVPWALQDSAGPTEGGFPICHIGCAKRIWLVVTGPEAGNVWQDDRAEDGGVYPMRDAEGRRLTFAAWYMAWLDEALKQLDPAP